MIVAVIININKNDGEFPGSLVVRIQGFHCCGLGSIPGQGTEILQAAQHGEKKRKKEKRRLEW